MEKLFKQKGNNGDPETVVFSETPSVITLQDWLSTPLIPSESSWDSGPTRKTVMDWFRTSFAVSYGSVTAQGAVFEFYRAKYRTNYEATLLNLQEAYLLRNNWEFLHPQEIRLFAKAYRDVRPHNKVSQLSSAASDDAILKEAAFIQFNLVTGALERERESVISAIENLAQGNLATLTPEAFKTALWEYVKKVRSLDKRKKGGTPVNVSEERE